MTNRKAYALTRRLHRPTPTTSGLMLWWRPMHRPDVDRLKELIAAGKVTPRSDRRYRLDEVVQALRWVEDGHARGKVVITVADA